MKILLLYYTFCKEIDCEIIPIDENKMCYYRFLYYANNDDIENDDIQKNILNIVKIQGEILYKLYKIK